MMPTQGALYGDASDQLLSHHPIEPPRTVGGARIGEGVAGRGGAEARERLPIQQVLREFHTAIDLGRADKAQLQVQVITIAGPDPMTNRPLP